MISEDELLIEIEKHINSPSSYTTLEKLSNLFTVHDHLYGEPHPNERSRNAEENKISGDTDFLKAVNHAGLNKSFEVLDELMTVLKISHTRLYDSVMRKLDEKTEL